MSFAQWLATTWISAAMRNERLFTLVDIVHQLAMAVFLGTITLVSLRLLGLFMTARRVSDVARGVRLGTAVALATLLVTGPLLAVPEPVRWYTDGPFWLKMAILAAALVFHFAVFRPVTRRDLGGRWAQGLTGLAALALWFSVGWMGRLITVL